jgi:hypothetical protein
MCGDAELYHLRFFYPHLFIFMGASEPSYDPECINGLHNFVRNFNVYFLVDH